MIFPIFRSDIYLAKNENIYFDDCQFYKNESRFTWTLWELCKDTANKLDTAQKIIR